MNKIISKAMDAKGFAKIFETYRSRYITYSFGYVKDENAAEDIVMDAFVAVWQKRDTISEEELPAYMMTAVKNKCLNYLKSQKVRSEAAEILKDRFEEILDLKIATLKACDPESLLGEEVMEILNKTLDSMTLKTRNIFMRNRFHGETYREIAENLGLTVKNVEFEISKALKLLRFNLKDYIVFSLVFLF